jgi:hypothetical protein
MESVQFTECEFGYEKDSCSVMRSVEATEARSTTSERATRENIGGVDAPILSQIGASSQMKREILYTARRSKEWMKLKL